ncbi:hypothetical protein [Bradyrhizobium arachidis]|uniref:hypothetical protein n=1 Tax=Bradyrhizobium arachidis TaxID=858423 RepID=UPI0021626473|nr:hypothetical protein [Bradyrhizobium arachidis]UVO30277.1 hypothetical protein KUF59_05880 [Bradyrhizobium arachidis]
MSGAIEGVSRTNLASDGPQSADQRQELESAFGSVVGLVTIQMMERNMANLHEAVTETEEDA